MTANGNFSDDFSVPQAIDVDRIPECTSPRRADPDELPLLGCLDDQTHSRRVSFRNNVLLGCMQVGESGDDRMDLHGVLLAPLDGPQCAPVE